MSTHFTVCNGMLLPLLLANRPAFIMLFCIVLSSIDAPSESMDLLCSIAVIRHVKHALCRAAACCFQEVN